MSRLTFKIEAEASGSRARAATFTTMHGTVRTPVFMPVGTHATVKGMRVEDLKATGAQVLLANTYHLLLRPGPEVFRRFGGIHRFMNWDGPVLTDSGGFQIFSMPGTRRIREDGAEFRSYVDGQRIFLTPELSIETQKAIQSDIMMVLDECVPSTCAHAEAERAMHLTHRWAKRSLAARGDSPQALFGIVQGACFPDLRRSSAEFLTQLPFDGFAIGGLAVGETRAEREDFTELTTGLLPRHLPRYLMGVGTPIDLLEAVHRGVDMFDCIIPSSHAQQGTAFTHDGILRFRRGVYKFSEEALDPSCSCYTCARYSRAYLHHLSKVEEGLGWHLIAHHNQHFYRELMAQMREHVITDTFTTFYRAKRETIARLDTGNANAVPTRRKPKAGAAVTLGNFEVRVGASGFAHIHDARSGEAMHPFESPDEEAQEVYVSGSRLRERLAAAGEPLVVWDVGLGAAHNAMAAVRCAMATAGAQRPLELISFENDMDALRLSLKHLARFPHLKHGAPHHLAADGEWRSPDGRVHWRLIEGDFLEKMALAPTPDVIYFDPFSYKTDAPLWTLASFQAVRAACREKAVELFTYSTSTAVRAAMLGAGFLVARGRGVGGRQESTIALTPAAWQARPTFFLEEGISLDGRWLERWERSSAKYPHGLPDGEKAGFEASVRQHAQFNSQSLN